jgi:succinate dehydrogenase / fumarate reductase iron-sulfur subunit
MTVLLEIQRAGAEGGQEPTFARYRVEVGPETRILDALLEVKRTQDGSLSFRKSCAHGVCGSDAVRINGRERLACKTLVRDLVTGDGRPVRIEPLRYLRVQRDLDVDFQPFFEKSRQVKPFLIAAREAERAEYLQSPQERALIDDASRCIQCAACYSACPVLETKPNFLGPAAIVQAARFVLDSRDRGLEPRLEALDNPDGVWSCENHFECTRVCPRGIKVTKLINLMKNRIKRYRESGRGGG